MRYELDANGYVLKVFWGCNSGNCTEYTGKVPSGYKNLTEWSENALINAYYIVDGNLVLDSDKLAELQAIIEQETIDNTPVFYKDIYGTNEVLDSQYQSKTASGQVIAVDNVKRVNPKVKITDIKCYDYDKIDIISQGKNMLKNDAVTETISGITFTRNSDSSITINGTSIEAIEYNLSGSSTNTTSIFALKKDEEYYFNIGELDCEMKFYDGTTSQVYKGTSGVISLSENKEVTQVLITIPTGTTINKTIYPQLEYGSVATEYEKHKERRITISFSEFIKSNFIPASDTLYVSEDLYPLGTTIEYIYIENGSVYISVDGVSKYLMTGNVNLFNGFNTVYTMQDANVEMTYSIDELIGSFTGDVYSTEGNKVVGKYGILTNLQFIGNSFNWYGQHNIDSAGAWFLGFNTELTGTNWANFIKADAYIPEGFKVTEAKLTIVHKPVLWGDDSSVTGYCKNIEAYKISNIKTSTILAAYCSEYDVTSGYTFSKIDNAMGKGGHTFNSTEVETFISNDISDIFEDINGNTVSGNYQIAIKTRDSVPILSDNPNYWLGKDTGHVYMILNIIGYMPNNTNR